MINKIVDLWKIVVDLLILQTLQVMKLILLVFGSAAVFHAVAILFGASITEYVFENCDIEKFTRILISGRGPN